MPSGPSTSPVLSILPLRFQVNEQALQNLGAHILTIDWMKPARSLLEQHATLNLTRDRKAHLPTLSLDTALSAVNPVLAHSYKYLDADRSYTMCIDDAPNPALLASLSACWADTWAERHLPSGALYPEYQPLRQRIETQRTWQAMSAHQVLYDKDKSSFRYSVIPSILANLFANGGASLLGGRSVNWCLAQQAGSNGWQVVSEPISGAQNATFAYLIRFSVQYQPGVDAPRIHAAVVCQRYADNPVTYSGDRRVSVLCRLGRPLMTNGSWTNNLVRLIILNVGSAEATFGVGFPEVLQRAQARSLADPTAILAEPRKFRGESDHADRYLVVHFEGLETEQERAEQEEKGQGRGTHGIGTGFDLGTRREIYETILERLGQWLSPSSALPKVSTTRGLHSVKPWPHALGALKSDKLLGAFSVANSGNATLLLLSHSPGIGEAMEFFARRVFHLAKDDAWPEWLTVRHETIPDELARKLEVPDGSQRLAQRRADVERKVADAWAAFLQPFKSRRLYAWIELPPTLSDFTSPHDAIRCGCVEAGCASQMIKPLEVASPTYLMDMGHKRNYHGAMEDFGRMFNAANDLLVRQSGTTRHGELARDARMAGYPAEQADQLSVVGMTIFRANGDSRRGRTDVVIPAAVKIAPDGVVQVFSEAGWIHYYDAAMEFGKLFIQTERRQNVWNERPIERDQRVNDYFQHMLQTVRGEPTLLIIDAVRTRNFVKSMKVMELHSGSMIVGGSCFNRLTHPHLTAVWARFNAQAENVQYVGQREDGSIERVADQSLFEDPDAAGVFRHYYSVGKRLPGTEEQDGYGHPDPELRYRYQQAIELVPFFGDETLLLPSVLLTHGLRSGPHFELSSLTAPYPIHLANAMFTDLVSLLGVLPDETSA